MHFIPKIRIYNLSYIVSLDQNNNGHGKMGSYSYNKKEISLFFAIAIAGFLGALLASYNSTGDRKNSPLALKSNKPFYQPQELSEKTSTQGGSLFN
jgi:hypothetical protein